MSDLISRGDAIKAVLASNLSACTVFGRSEEGMATAKELIQVIKNLPSVQTEPLTLRVNSELTKEEYDKLMQDIKEAPGVLLPSVQPEPLTEKEQRIFLAAMGREEKVCEEVDRHYIREPYEDSLMSVCREIKRKVKGALWTI